MNYYFTYNIASQNFLLELLSILRYIFLMIHHKFSIGLVFEKSRSNYINFITLKPFLTMWEVVSIAECEEVLSCINILFGLEFLGYDLSHSK